MLGGVSFNSNPSLDEFCRVVEKQLALLQASTDSNDLKLSEQDLSEIRKPVQEKYAELNEGDLSKACSKFNEFAFLMGNLESKLAEQENPTINHINKYRKLIDVYLNSKLLNKVDIENQIKKIETFICGVQNQGKSVPQVALLIQKNEDLKEKLLRQDYSAFNEVEKLLSSSEKDIKEALPQYIQALNDQSTEEILGLAEHPGLVSLRRTLDVYLEMINQLRQKLLKFENKTLYDEVLQKQQEKVTKIDLLLYQQAYKTASKDENFRKELLSTCQIRDTLSPIRTLEGFKSEIDKLTVVS